jgi:MFS family permease
LVQGGLIRRIAHKVDEARLIQAGTFIQSAAFAMLAASPLMGQWSLYPAGALLALGNGLTQPSISAFVSRRADATKQGTTLSANQSVAALARTMGPAFGGFLYGHLGRTAPYTVAAAGMALALLFALRLPMRPADTAASS